MRNQLVTAALLLVLAAAAPASGCPVCDTGTGQQVRAAIVDTDLLRNLLAVTLPFAVLLGVAAVIHGLPSRPRNRHDD